MSTFEPVNEEHEPGCPARRGDGDCDEKQPVVDEIPELEQRALWGDR
jgi:hypothetical protein